jgi:isoquinoline 1-oxidoreductase beta subunit
VRADNPPVGLLLIHSDRSRGVAMASPFGSEVATITEVSVKDNEVVVHDIWVAMDPGRIVNPAIIEA